MIGFAFDYTSTAALLAFKPTCALADELGVAVEWLPFPTEPTPARPPKADETVSERHARVRTEYVARDVRRYAKLQGVEVTRDAAGVDSTVACGGCLWAARHDMARAYSQRVLADFWGDRLDIEEPGAIDAVLTELGAPGFAGFDFGAELAAHRAAVEARGVFGVPTYIVAEQLFIGRAHLPMIRWLLGDREGPGPL